MSHTSRQKTFSNGVKRRAPKLGQHFLTGLWAAKKLAECVAVRSGETILEIGPGRGALTRELLATGASVVAVEKDEALVAQLEETFARELANKKLRIVEDDIRSVTPKKLHLSRYVVAANIPYYITGEIIRTFLEAEPQPRALALLIQKEVAKRVIARNGKESILSLSVKAYGSPRIVAAVSRGNFSPPPSVDSAVLLIDNVSKDFFADIGEKEFFRVVRAGFASKRKYLANNLAVSFQLPVVQKAFETCGLDPKVRAEDIALEQWKRLVRSVRSVRSLA